MPSRSSESPADDGVNYLHEVPEPPLTELSGSLQDDVERLIEVAAQLFSAIERQIHLMEEELVVACGEHVRSFAQTVFKERLISCAVSLETSIKEIALNLEGRGIEQGSFGALRDNSYG